LGARGVARSKFYTVGPQILGATYKIYFLWGLGTLGLCTPDL